MELMFVVSCAMTGFFVAAGTIESALRWYNNDWEN